MINEVLAQNLKRLRKEKNLYQKEVAAGLGIEEPRYKSWEYARCQPDLDNLKKLAEFHKTTVDKLLSVHSD